MLFPFFSLNVFPISLFSLTFTCLYLQATAPPASTHPPVPAALSLPYFFSLYLLFSSQLLFFSLSYIFFPVIFFRGGRVRAIWGQSTKKKTFNLSSPENNWKSSRNDSIWIVSYIEVYVKVSNLGWNFSCFKQENENANLSYVFALDVILSALGNSNDLI